MLVRKTCPSMYRVHMGPQVLPVFLGRDESVCFRRWPQDSHTLGRVEHCADCHTELHRQPILADEVQTFKALITVHKVLQEGHPIAVRDAQANVNWLESLTRGVTGEGLRGKAISKGAYEHLFDKCPGKISMDLTDR